MSDQNIKISIAMLYVTFWEGHFPLFFRLGLKTQGTIALSTYLFYSRIINWPWEIIFVPTWIVLCISLVGVLYTIIFAGILLRMTEVNAEQRRTSTNSALGNTDLFEGTIFSNTVFPQIVSALE